MVPVHRTTDQSYHDNTNDTNHSPSSSTVHSANHVHCSLNDSSNRIDSATTMSTPSTASTASADTQQITMSRRNDGGLAFVTTHQTNMATQDIPEHPIHAHTAITNESNRERITSISDWLIDSGCTAHMSNCLDDFIGLLERYETLVEVANGGVTHVSHRGRTRVHIRDLFQTNHSALVTLSNVLYVPGLTRRLISIVEWNSCGGHILF
jgi:hypothetical protein